MNEDANPVWTLVWTFGLMSLFAVGGANAAIPEMPQKLRPPPAPHLPLPPAARAPSLLLSPGYRQVMFCLRRHSRICHRHTYDGSAQ